MPPPSIMAASIAGAAFLPMPPACTGASAMACCCWAAASPAAVAAAGAELRLNIINQGRTPDGVLPFHLFMTQCFLLYQVSSSGRVLRNLWSMA